MKNLNKSHRVLRYMLLPIIMAAGLVSILGTGDDDGTNTLVFTANEGIDWVALQDGDWVRMVMRRMCISPQTTVPLIH